MGEKKPLKACRDTFLAGSKAPPPSLPRELLDFVLHGKRWWLTPILVVLALLAAFALLAGIAPITPFIYTLF